MIDEILSFVDQCDDLPSECFDGTLACTCQSFLMPFFLLITVVGAVGILSVVRMFSKSQSNGSVSK